MRWSLSVLQSEALCRATYAHLMLLQERSTRMHARIQSQGNASRVVLFRHQTTGRVPIGGIFRQTSLFRPNFVLQCVHVTTKEIISWSADWSASQTLDADWLFWSIFNEPLPLRRTVSSIFYQKHPVCVSRCLVCCGLELETWEDTRADLRSGIARNRQSATSGDRCIARALHQRQKRSLRTHKASAGRQKRRSVLAAGIPFPTCVRCFT